MSDRYVAVVGPGDAAPELLALAEETGAAVAAAGAVLVSGGLGGTMEAACRGAKSRRGTTLGVLPGADRADANGWVDVAVATGMGEMRNALVVRAADAVVALAGGWGTLSEIAFARKTGTPVVAVGWDLEGVPRVDDPAGAVAEALRLASAGGRADASPGGR